MKEITYRLTGAQTAQETVAGGSATIPITAEGATTIAYHATDNAGNAEFERTLVVRIDKTAPVVSCTAGPRVLWPANHTLVPVTVRVKVQDGRSGSSGFTLVSVTSNEPDDAPGNGDGATVGDIGGFDLGTSDTAGRLRAERAGTGRGRVYTLTYVGRDAVGNQRTCATTVTVPHDCSGAAVYGAPMTVALFAGIRVRDVTAARAWYERLLGEPSFFPNATEVVWTLAVGRCTSRRIPAAPAAR